MDKPIDPLFQVHMLNDAGKEKARAIARHFTDLTEALAGIGSLDGCEGAIVKTKLEEAAFFAKKAVANKLVNQEGV